MAKTKLQGPYQLSDSRIDEVVNKTSAGTYVLGHINSRKVFIVEYVGRSDDDLNDRLHDWVEKYKMFKAAYFNSAQEAFAKECIIYHDFGGNGKLDNEYHPDRPDNTNWKCPVCDIFG